MSDYFSGKSQQKNQPKAQDSDRTMIAATMMAVLLKKSMVTHSVENIDNNISTIAVKYADSLIKALESDK